MTTPPDPGFARLLDGLAMPPLHRLPRRHVLTRSYYLLDGWPGRRQGEPLWVETPDARPGTDVSAVVAGSHDWASAWAGGRSLPGGPRQHEQALRFGVNLVMYALTGTYKADQVHAPTILERLEGR